MRSSLTLASAFLIGLMGFTNCSKKTSATSTQTGGGMAGEQLLAGDDLTKARTNYTNYCGGCHGRSLETFVNRKWQHGDSPEALFKGIKHGYPDQGMPSYDTTFTDQEIRHLVSYIREGIVAQRGKT